MNRCVFEHAIDGQHDIYLDGVMTVSTASSAGEVRMGKV